MRLELKRTKYYPDRTIGEFYINGNFSYYSLEDTDRGLESGGEKIAGQTAIPKGVYKVTMSYSNRFKKMMPHVLDVPQFTGIRIHAGNTPEDTEGCILLGMEYNESDNTIIKSTLALNDFVPKLIEGLESEDIYLEIS